MPARRQLPSIRVVRDMLAAEQQKRWEITYRELRRRQKVLERATEKGRAILRAYEDDYAERGCDEVGLRAMWDDIEANRTRVEQIAQAAELNAARLREHERALPGLRDTDPLAMLAQSPHEHCRITASTGTRAT